MAEPTTLGTLLVNEALPPALQKTQHRLDKKGVHALFTAMAEQHPDEYKTVLHRLSELGRNAVWTEGSSVSLAALSRSKAKEAVMKPLRDKIKAIVDDDALSDDARRDAIVEALLPATKAVQDAVYEEARQEHSPYVNQIESGARGKRSDLSSLRGADLLTTDQSDRLIPLPLTNSYAEGFTPAQYFASTYGQRKGALGVKLATADAGYYGKRIVNAAHRMVVDKDVPEPTRLPVGLPVDTKDRDNVGAVLAVNTGPYKAGQVLTAAMLDELQDDNHDQILVHSPMTEVSRDGGISKWAAGRRNKAGFNDIGDNIGIPAAQAISERLSQGSLSSKHSSGVSDRHSRSGFEYLNRLLEAPETFPEAGPLAQEDGVISGIRPAAQGGTYVVSGPQEYYLPPGIKPVVAVGQKVEAGDDLSDGVPHPADLIRLRGVGEARRVYLQHYREALEASGIPVHRRNAEAVVAGLINWAKVTSPDGIGDSIYGDTIPYNTLSAQYQPRQDAQETAMGQSALGRYLEEPALHYTPGTRITKRVADDLKKWGIAKAYTHQDAPDFEPEFVRGVHAVSHDPDWKTRLTGFYTASSFEKALHRGLDSDTESTSYAPAVSTPAVLGQNLGTTGKYGQAQ
jgi:hypothetical protein